jgi:hypothetical protein
MQDRHEELKSTGEYERRDSAFCNFFLLFHLKDNFIQIIMNLRDGYMIDKDVREISLLEN